MIQPSPTAPLGSVTHLPEYTTATFPSSSAILCRLNAPLVSFAFSLIQRGVGCRVLGREIGQGLITLVKKLDNGGDDLAVLQQKLEMYESRETEKLLRRGEEQAADNIHDRVQCLELFITHSSSVDDLLGRISALFDDSASGLLTLSSIHKAKGLEWPKVFLLDRFELMPSKFAKLPWQQVQERNLIYVAMTRAQIDLVYIKSGKWLKTENEKKRAEANSPSSPLLAYADED